MALIDCPECGKGISDKATHCIHCGYPLSNTARTATGTQKSAGEHKALLVAKFNALKARIHPLINKKNAIIAAAIAVLAVVACIVLTLLTPPTKNWETISAGTSHTVGLKSDGTVVAVGHNVYGECDVSGWSDIVAISAGTLYTVGLKSDGTVVAVGYNYNINGWSDIVAISASTGHTVGLKSDGTVVAVGWNEYGQCDVSGWSDIVAISAGYEHTVGLKSDGTVVAVGG